MAKLLRILDSVQLNLTEWFIVGLAATVAGLVAALKLQGSRLHKAQLELLDHRFAVTDERTQTAADNAKLAYMKARNDYKNAGGKL